MNYITTLGYPDHEDMAKYWPIDMHVIGKDIIRFHAAIWPAMIMGLGLDLPKQIYVHGFINVGGRKMSKSFGNGVSPTDMVSKYGSDATRYYLLRHVPSHGDGDFTWEKFEAVYNGELGNDLGNLVQRIATMINKYQKGVIGDIPGPEHDEGPYHEAMDEIRFDAALDYVWGLIRGLNQYLEEQKPWSVALTGDEEHVREILTYSVGALMQVAGLLGPFMPKTSEMIQAIFSDGMVKSYKGVMFPKVENYK
jgi:methionyl-tRNA synthetase